MTMKWMKFCHWVGGWTLKRNVHVAVYHHGQSISVCLFIKFVPFLFFLSVCLLNVSYCLVFLSVCLPIKRFSLFVSFLFFLFAYQTLLTVSCFISFYLFVYQAFLTVSCFISFLSLCCISFLSVCLSSVSNCLLFHFFISLRYLIVFCFVFAWKKSPQRTSLYRL